MKYEIGRVWIRHEISIRAYPVNPNDSSRKLSVQISTMQPGPAGIQ